MAIDRARLRRLAPRYLIDWAVVIVLLVVSLLLDLVPPYHREFSITDTSIAYPYKTSEIVPPWLLFIICFVIPFVLITLTVLFRKPRSFFDWHQTFLGLVMALSYTVVFTQVFKITVGELRPDFLSRCEPNPGIKNPEYGLVTSSICNQTDTALLYDGMKSFLSGHSSCTFAGMLFLSLFWAGKLATFNRKQGSSWKLALFFAPLLVAALVAVSRLDDYRHHWQDVLLGSLLGIFIAYLSYRTFFPALTQPGCSLPYGSQESYPSQSNPTDLEQGQLINTTETSNDIHHPPPSSANHIDLQASSSSAPLKSFP